MNMAEAKEELKKLADGRAYSVQYGLTESRNGRLTQECMLYIDGFDWIASDTWRAVMDDMVEIVTGIPTDQFEDLSAISEIEKGLNI